ncbi:MAG TPA: twin-arginine translocase TatA/TatE family subunit [Ilumatobacteraceae bacterium]|nr:twin-arginine translocase TatA/TatE family subunit [Ilumatobacteraceae bacterium]
MFNLQGSEIVVILLLALVVLGPEKLPDAVRKFTQTYAELKKMSTGFQSELKSALDEPMREMRDTANLLRDAADPSKLTAEAEAERRVLDDADVATERITEPSPANEWAAPTPGTADPSRNGATPFEPLAQPGDDQVATPGDPRENS